MSRLRVLIIAFFAVMLLGSCKFGSTDATSQRQMHIVELDKDSMLYGVYLGMQGMDSLLFMYDEGDTAWLMLTDNVRMLGPLQDEDRVALMLADDGHRVDMCINTSLLMGQWVEPDPVAEGSMRGFMLAEGGAAQSINIPDLNYDNWRLANGQLLLYASYTEGYGQNFTDTFNILLLGNDSLWLRGSQRKFLHRLRNGETTDISANYTVDPDMGMDFSPETADKDIPAGEYNDDDGRFFNPDYDVVP